MRPNGGLGCTMAVSCKKLDHSQPSAWIWKTGQGTEHGTLKWIEFKKITGCKRSEKLQKLHKLGARLKTGQKNEHLEVLRGRELVCVKIFSKLLKIPVQEHKRQLLSITLDLSSKVGWKWKWSNGVGKGKIIFNITNNVKSCQKKWVHVVKRIGMI